MAKREASRHPFAMLGFAITSWIRFFFFGLLAGAILCFARFPPIAFLGMIDTIAALLGLALTILYARSYEPRAWRRLLVRTRRWRNLAVSLVHKQDPMDHARGRRALLSP